MLLIHGFAEAQIAVFLIHKEEKRDEAMYSVWINLVLILVFFSLCLFADELAEALQEKAFALSIKNTRS